MIAHEELVPGFKLEVKQTGYGNSFGIWYTSPANPTGRLLCDPFGTDLWFSEQCAHDFIEDMFNE